MQFLLPSLNPFYWMTHICIERERETKHVFFIHKHKVYIDEKSFLQTVFFHLRDSKLMERKSNQLFVFFKLWGRNISFLAALHCSLLECNAFIVSLLCREGKQDIKSKAGEIRCWEERKIIGPPNECHNIPFDC